MLVTSRNRSRLVPAVLGLVLLAASILKAHELATGTVAEDGLLTSRWFRITLVELELALGLWLFSGSYPKQARLAALVVFAGFCLVSLYQALTGAASCGCFGKLHINPWNTLLFDLLAVSVLWRWNPRMAGEHLLGGGRSHSFRIVAFGLLFLLAGIPAALAMSSYRPALLSAQGEIVGDGPDILLEPETWAGRRFPLLTHIDIGEQLANGKWLVMIYHHDCPRCREAIRRLQTRSNRRQEGVALIELPPYETSPFTTLSVTGRRWRLGRLSGERQWFVETPVFIELENGWVLEPCPAALRISPEEASP